MTAPLMRRLTTAVVVSVLGHSVAAQAPRDTAAVLDSVAREILATGPRLGPAVWPNFRPDTIPIAFVLPTHGTMLFNWPGPLPRGFSVIDGVRNAVWRDERALGAASTGSELDGRPVAQVAIGPAQPLNGPMLVATALHEAFHVFERASMQQGRRFGGSENSALVGTYPVFDVDNEAAFAMEGRILHTALVATSVSQRRELAREFIGVRQARHRRLSGSLVDFEQMAEMNEGLANYALTRAYEHISANGPAPWRDRARRELSSVRDQLTDLTGATSLSLRFRFYLTGPAQASLLDHLVGDEWKAWIQRDNWTLEDALARATGVDETAEKARERAERVYDAKAVRASATESVKRLKASRLAKVDSVLSGPGIRLVLLADSLPARSFNSCGYDPQNLLQVTAKVRIQTRWWRPCGGGPTYAEFNVPSVQDDSSGTIKAMIGGEAEIVLTSNGQRIELRDGETRRDVMAFKLQAPRASVDAARADVVRRGNEILIYPKRGGS